ncbi:unnamed protein product [Closterium sp. NIES-64]|nr:unnamed protein product [Closterium sp. NIES-64]
MVAAHGYPAYRCFKTMQRRRPDMHEVLFFCSSGPCRIPPSLRAAHPAPSPRTALRLSVDPSVPSVLPTPACTVLPHMLGATIAAGPFEGLAAPLLDCSRTCRCSSVIVVSPLSRLPIRLHMFATSAMLLLHSAALPLLDTPSFLLLAHVVGSPSFVPTPSLPRSAPSQGTEIVYGSMLQPLLTRHEPIIDRHLAHLRGGGGHGCECWRAGVAYTGARFEELIAYLASLSAQAAASAALRGMDGSGRREERERRESEVEVLRSERPDGAEGRKGEEEQQEEVRGRRKYLQQYGGEAVQLRSAVGVQKGGYERRLQGEETEGTPNNGRKAEAEEQRVQQGSEQREGVQRQAVRYRNVDSDSDGDGGGERWGEWWEWSEHPSNSQARQAAPPPAMLHGTLPPAALLPAGVAGGQGGGSIDAAAAGFDDVAPDQVDDVAAATVVGEASPHPSGINLRPRRSHRPKKQF